VSGADIEDDSIESADIKDGTIVNADISASAAIVYSKLSIADNDIPISKINTLQTSLDAKVNKDGSNPPALLIAESTDNPYLLLKETSSGGDGTITGLIQFNGTNSASEDTTFAEISGKIIDETNASEEGALLLGVMKAGTLSTALELTSTQLTIIADVGIGVTPTEKLDIDGDAIRLRSSKTPASASDTGTAGVICWDSTYVYVCVATNTWKRALLSTW
jgi:hypothetical protein